jgi:hypothetical protein
VIEDLLKIGVLKEELFISGSFDWKNQRIFKIAIISNLISNNEKVMQHLFYDTFQVP